MARSARPNWRGICNLWSPRWSRPRTGGCWWARWPRRICGINSSRKRGGRLHATEVGRRQADHFIGANLVDAAIAGVDDWPSVRDPLLVAKALGMPGVSPRRLKNFGKADGLGCAIVAAAHGLKLKSTPSASRLRNALALLALDRAFGNRLQRDPGTKSGLSAKAGRLLAGQLSIRPRDFGTDSRLVAGLAVEAVGATGGSVAALRTALLRGFVTGAFDWPLTPGATPARTPAVAKAAPMRRPVAVAPAPTPVVPKPPSPSGPVRRRSHERCANWRDRWRSACREAAKCSSRSSGAQSSSTIRAGASARSSSRPC